MPGWSRQIASLLLGLAVSMPASALGEAAGASELFRQGVEALRERDYPEAASLFRLSYDMEPRAATQCNLALTYERWGGHDEEALEAYRRCAEEDREGRFQEHARRRSLEIRQRLDAARAAETDEAADEAYPQQGEGSRDAGSSEGAPPRRPTVIRHPLLWAGVGLGAVALASFGTAIGLHVWSQGIHDDLSDDYPGGHIPEGSQGEDLLSQGEAGAGAALGLYITGGVLAAAAAVLVVIDLTQADSEVEATLIGVAPTPGGLVLGGLFRFE